MNAVLFFTNTVLKGKSCQEYDIHERQHFALLQSYKIIKIIFFKKNDSSKRFNALYSFKGEAHGYIDAIFNTI
jgi:uncharacterized Fe-S radical SAM superfamily protein PflX